MTTRKTVHIITFEDIYKRLEELMLANSGENEFEEIFKLVVIKLWKELNAPESTINTVNEANRCLQEIDQLWKGILLETKLCITEEQFAVCWKIVSTFDFTKEGYEGIDAIFEFLISKEKKGSKGQYFTPRYIVDFCVKILNPKAGESVLDPATGSGAFLYHSYLNGLSNGVKLWGFDFDNTAVRIARLLMYVGNVQNFHIHKVNSLIKNGVRSNLFETGISEISTTIEDILRIEKFKGLFDIIITNPPFAGEIIEPDILESYYISSGKLKIERDVLFVERCIELLKPGGRMAIILPDNIFGAKENESLRKWILERCRIIGVIGIPRNAFMPHTSVKTSILFIQKRDTKRTGDENIFFGISEKPGKDSRGKVIYKCHNTSSWRDVDHDLDEIFVSFKTFLKKEGVRW